MTDLAPARRPAPGAECRRSHDAFAGRFPELAAKLADPPAVSKPVVEDGAVVDIDLGAGRLYRGDGRKSAALQVAAFLERPLQFFVSDLRGVNAASPVSRRLIRFMTEDLAQRGIGALNAKPDHGGAYLVVLGLGLGFHLRDLMKGTKAKYVIIVEPHDEFLRHSLAAIDWAELLDEAEADGREVHFVSSKNADDIVGRITHIVFAKGIPFIDGSYVFLHYPDWVLVEARNRLHEAVNEAFLSRGYFEDELVMMTNAFANLARYDFRLVDERPGPRREEPVIVIASGPSIDGTIEHVKRLRERAIVLSCGTSLRVCLRNGIVPDFHCEIENGPEVLDSLEFAAAEFDLKKITLVASLTVNPAVPDLFGERLFFFRDAVSSTRIMAAPKNGVRGVFPTVANTALAIGSVLGFTRFHLFGTDCGAKAEGAKHSRDTLYMEIDAFKEHESGLEFPQVVPGNFGGIARTDLLFDLSRRNLAAVIRARRIKVFNCSDGALIEGTTPKLAESLEFDGPALERAAIKDRLAGAMKRYEAGEFLAALPFERYRSEARRFFDDGLAMIRAARAQDRDFVEFWRRMSEFFAAAMESYDRIAAIVAGSARSMPKIGMFFAHRLADDGDRAYAFQAFLGEYERIFEHMRDGALELLARLDAEWAEIRPARDATLPM
ncbi:MAG: motility associated factor glycosyltransferase family protein [Pseudomonadota bacterium]